MVTKDDDAALGTVGVHVFILFHSEAAHGGDGKGSSSSTKALVFLKVNGIVSAEALQAIIFFLVAGGPGRTIWMG